MRIALLMCALSASAVVLAQTPANLVKNPSMEIITADGFAADWRGGEFGKPGKNVVIDRQEAHSGQCSIRLATSPGSFVTCAAADIAVKPQTTYFVSWWCKTQDMTMSRAYVWLQTNKAQRVVPDDSQYMTQDWTQHFARYTTTEDETSLHPVLTTHHTSGPECHAWFDDVGVYEGGFPEPLLSAYKTYEAGRSWVSETAVLLSRTNELTVWADDLAARVYREDGVPDYAVQADEVGLAAARGETVYSQVVLLPTRDVPPVVLAPGDLTGPDTIDGTQVHWWPVGFANVKTAHRQGTRLGPTPDPLLRPEPIALTAGENAPFLVGVTVPRDAKPGTYTGAIIAQAGDTTLAAIPLSVRVYDFELPRDPTFRTLITYSASSFRPWDRRPLEEIERDIARVLHAHGVRGNGATATVPARLVDGKVVCDFADFDRRIQWFIDSLQFNAFFLGPCFGGGTSEGWEKHSQWLGLEPLSEEFNRLFPQYMRQVGQHLRDKGWLSMAYLYLWDEPEPDYFDRVVALQKLALAGDPDFKIWETTSPNHEAFYGVVKAWSVPFGRPHFTEASVDARRAAGDEIWVYNIPATLEAPPQLHRLWFWQAARYGAVGAQLWQTTFYNKIDPWEDITPVPWVTGRNQESLYVYDAGEAILLYPDKEGGPPLPTLRLKLMQKGIDDFEYLTILQERLKTAAERDGVADPAAFARAEMRRVADTLVRDIGSYNLDQVLLGRTREAIARRIEEGG